MTRDVEHRDPGELVAYEANTKTHPADQIALIERSIREFGWTVPVLVDAQDVIVAGHARVDVAKRMGLATVPTIRLDDLTPEQLRAYRIADNRLTELGGWDTDLLQRELAALDDAGFELRDHGVLARRLWQHDAVSTGGDGDDVPDPPAEPVTQLGDVWTLGRHRLICGDSADEAAVARVLAGNEPALMVTDPPFGVNYDPTWRDEAGKAGRLQWTAKRTEYMDAAADTEIDWPAVWKLSPSTIAYIWQAHVGVVPTARVLEDLGWQLRNLIVWSKQSPVISRGQYANQVEFCWYGVQKGATAEWIGPPSVTNLWAVSWESDTRHAAQKPLELMERPMTYHRGDVYEPFCGSGTTLIAAERHARRCFAIELSPAFCDVIVERWQNLTGRKAEREESE